LKLFKIQGHLTQTLKDYEFSGSQNGQNPGLRSIIPSPDVVNKVPQFVHHLFWDPPFDCVQPEVAKFANILFVR
jgi:hypothetical protein